MKYRKSDILWKTILEEVFEDMLRFVYQEADEVCDMERGFEFLDKELAELDPQPDEKKDTRFPDKLVKVYHRNGKEECILLHVEVQEDTRDKEAFAERMFTYFYRIRDRYKGCRLSALAIYTGLASNDMPGWYSYSSFDTELTYRYKTFSINDYQMRELNKSTNPFALVVMAAKVRLLEDTMPEEKLLGYKLMLTRKLLRKGLSAKKTQAILGFLRNYILFDDPEMNRKFDKQILKKNKPSAMTMLEYERLVGEEIGEEKGHKDGIIVLLTNTDFSVEKIADLMHVSIDFVNKIKEDLARQRRA